jgi:predicted  nucleic acid-binding Zn-ribbon protein
MKSCNLRFLYSPMNDLQKPSLELETLRKERDLALEDAARWRQRYEIEAQQRRTEIEAADKTIHNLRAEVQQLSQMGQATMRAVVPSLLSAPLGNDKQALAAELARLSQARDELALALAQEQQQHAKTRENLISALGEALGRGKS